MRKGSVELVFINKPLYSLRTGNLLHFPSGACRKILYAYGEGWYRAYVLSLVFKPREELISPKETNRNKIGPHHVRTAKELHLIGAELVETRWKPAKKKVVKPPRVEKRRYCTICQNPLWYGNTSGLCKEHYLETYGSFKPHRQGRE